MIQADKGFNIVDECAARHIHLYVPPGKRDQAQMSVAANNKTTRVANLRILVEQVIARLKSFRIINSHTFVIDNHVRLHSSQNASYTGDVCDMHLRLTQNLTYHVCVICGTFHTEVNTHLPLCSTHNLLIKR